MTPFANGRTLGVATVARRAALHHPTRVEVGGRTVEGASAHRKKALMPRSSQRIHRGRRAALAVLLAVPLLVSMAAPTLALGEVSWVRQWGDEQGDGDWHTGFAVAPTSDSVYTAGRDDIDQTVAFIRRYSHAGALLWARNLAPVAVANVEVSAAAADDTGIYVGGSTTGQLPGQPPAHGVVEAWLARYAPNGERLWIRQFALGDAPLTGLNKLRIAPDGVFAALDSKAPDRTSAAYIRRYTRDGLVRWTRPMGSETSILGLDGLGDGVVVAVSTAGGAGLIRSYDGNGLLRWGRPASVEPTGIVALDDSSYVVASLTGTTLRLERYSAAGALLWSRNVSTFTRPPGALSDFHGTVYVAWAATGDREYVRYRAYSTAGAILFTRALDSGMDTRAWDLAVVAEGGYITGDATTAFPGETATGISAFLARFSIDTTVPDIEWASYPIPTIRLPPDDFSLRLRWSAKDDFSGLAGQRLQVNDGAGWQDEALSAPDVRSQIVDLKPFGTYRFRVRATDNSGNTSAYVVSPYLTLRLPQEDAPAIEYAGDWKSDPLAEASSGGVRWSSTPGSTATFTFTGDAVGFVTTTGPDRGRVKVLVDGTKVTTLDLHSSQLITRRVLFAKAWDEVGTHKVQLIVGGGTSAGRVDVDAFEVRSTSATQP